VAVDDVVASDDEAVVDLAATTGFNTWAPEVLDETALINMTLTPCLEDDLSQVLHRRICLQHHLSLLVFAAVAFLQEDADSIRDVME
jgi:hypothetical protein